MYLSALGPIVSMWPWHIKRCAGQEKQWRERTTNERTRMSYRLRFMGYFQGQLSAWKSYLHLPLPELMALSIIEQRYPAVGTCSALRSNGQYKCTRSHLFTHHFPSSGNRLPSRKSTFIGHKGHSVFAGASADCNKGQAHCLIPLTNQPNSIISCQIAGRSRCLTFE